MNSDDCYRILGVSRDCTQEEIKKAFRILAMRYHPDRNPDNQIQCEQKFKEINHAYEVVGDPRSRWLYDQTGMVQVNSGIDVPFGFRGRGCGRGMGRCARSQGWTQR